MPTKRFYTFFTVVIAFLWVSWQCNYIPSLTTPNKPPPPLKDEINITFLVATDLHYWQVTQTEDPALDRLVTSMNSFSNSMRYWPSLINNVETHFPKANSAVGTPLGVVTTGDLTHYGGDADPLGGPSYNDFKWDWDMTNDNPNHILYPTYIGLGNHDLGTEDDINRPFYHAQMLGLVREFHNRCDGNPISPVANYDINSDCYSWNWENVHCVQTHLYPGIDQYDWSNDITWLEEDLKKYASDGRPVILFQHYGFDSFSRQDEWTTEADRKRCLAAIKSYNIIAIFSGHSHNPKIFTTKEGYLNVVVNNAGPDPGDDDSYQPEFTVVNITTEGMSITGCKSINAQGGVRFVAPHTYVSF